MSQTLQIELSEQLFSVIQEKAIAAGIQPTELALDWLERSAGLSDKETDSTRKRALEKSESLESCFGTWPISDEVEMSFNNEDIDADLAREYASNHE